MEGDGGGEDDEVFIGGFVKLLGCDDLVEEGFLFSHAYSSSSSTTTSSASSSSSAGCYTQMLHFGGGGGGGHEEFLLFNGDQSDHCSLPEAAPAAASPRERSRARASKKVENTSVGGGVAKVASSRKPRAGSAGSTKVRKEKIGERISALQQLVSPFGKTDTSTVLHEAIGYIRFLHDQVKVLSSPYLQQTEGGDLRSRGLCLVPVSCTEDVANSSSIGADFWSSPAETTQASEQILPF